MDYTEIDPVAEADAILANNAVEQLKHAHKLGLDVTSLRWCADIAALTDSGDKGESAGEQAAGIEQQIETTRALAEALMERISKDEIRAAIPEVFEEQMKEWRPEYVRALEREHAQHAALAGLIVDDEQAENSRLQMLRCEAAHRAVLDDG